MFVLREGGGLLLLLGPLIQRATVKSTWEKDTHTTLLFLKKKKKGGVPVPSRHLSALRQLGHIALGHVRIQFADELGARLFQLLVIGLPAFCLDILLQMEDGLGVRLELRLQGG